MWSSAFKVDAPPAPEYVRRAFNTPSEATPPSNPKSNGLYYGLAAAADGTVYAARTLTIRSLGF